MKKALFLLMVFGLFSPGVKAQENVQVEQNIHTYRYSEVIQVPGADKEELFSRIKLFIPVFLKDLNLSNDAFFGIKEEHLESGFISTFVCVGTAESVEKMPIIGASWGGKAHIRYRSLLTIAVKDGRYKIDLGDLEFIVTTNSAIEFPKYTVITSENPCPYKGNNEKRDIRLNIAWNAAQNNAQEVLSSFVDKVKKAMSIETPTGGDW